MGRYIASKEKALELSQQRNGRLYELKNLIQFAIGVSATSMVAMDIDFDRAFELLSKTQAAHIVMLKAVAETNANAMVCGKPKLKIGR